MSLGTIAFALGLAESTVQCALRKEVSRQVLSGVEYLHVHGITHRDLKLENLLLGDGAPCPVHCVPGAPDLRDCVAFA